MLCVIYWISKTNGDWIEFPPWQNLFDLVWMWTCDRTNVVKRTLYHCAINVFHVAKSWGNSKYPITYIQKRNLYSSLLTNLMNRDIWMEGKFSRWVHTQVSCFVNQWKYWKRSFNGDSYICTYRPYSSFAQLGPTAGKWGASQDQGPHLSASCLGCLRPGRESRRVHHSNAISMKCFCTESFTILRFYLTQSPLVVGIQKFELKCFLGIVG